MRGKVTIYTKKMHTFMHVRMLHVRIFARTGNDGELDNVAYGCKHSSTPHVFGRMRLFHWQGRPTGSLFLARPLRAALQAETCTWSSPL